MQRHWQRRPLCIRAALDPASLVRDADGQAVERIDLRLLRELAADPDVESRLVYGPRFQARGRNAATDWALRQGPFKRLPAVSAPGWSLLVQGLDLHLDAARALLDRFRFVSDARLDDLMISFASDGGGVGAHVDSYDVFLLQLQGQRHWSVAPPQRGAGRGDDGVDPAATALRHLAHFEPTQTWLLEPGDMLYLPPGWGHDGVAVGPCLTASIGFRSPTPMQWLSAIHAMLEDDQDQAAAPGRRADPLAALGLPFRDGGAEATDHPGAIPDALATRLLAWQRQWQPSPDLLERALGRLLTEPKPQVWFEAEEVPTGPAALAGLRKIRLDRQTLLLYRGRYLFINGDIVEPPRPALRALQTLADRRALAAADLEQALRNPWLSATLGDWLAAGWIHGRT